MRKYIALIIMLLLTLGVKAQLVVEPGSFKEVPGFVILDHDKTDINDVPFAVIKVRTQNIDDRQRRELTFGGNLAVDTDIQYKVGEVWLYLTYHADYIKISHPDFSSTEFTFPYDMKPNGCYELTLVNNFNPGPKPEADMGGQYFVLTVTPATANVYVDGEPRATTDGELTIMLPYGEHKYRIEAPSFIGDEGTFTIGNTKVTKTVTLVSAQAQLTLSCGDASAELYLNDKKIGTGRWSGSLDAGMYVVEARRAGHSTVKQSLTLAKQERRSLTLDAPKPIYGKLNLNSTPGNCDVYLDGKKIGTSPDIFSNVLIGTHSIELRKEGYENATKQVIIEENKMAQATVALTKKQQPVPAGTSGGSASATGNKINGHEYVDLGLPSGTLWATCNVGASKPEDYGNYYAWGETTTKSTYNWSTYKWCRGSEKTQTKYNTKSDYGTVDNRTILEQADDAARANWGGAWRMPTYDEMKELKDKCTWTWTTKGGRNGYRVTGPNGNSIFLPAAGYYNDGSLSYAGSSGYYWSSSLYAVDPGDACYLGFGSGYVGMYYNGRDCGRSVRPVCPSQK